LEDNLAAPQLTVDELQVYTMTEPLSAALNMAVDEALLMAATIPTLRFYSWQRPSLSFGYFGRYGDVAADESERDIVRRWTGGGIVFHGEDLTYSLNLPAEYAARSSRTIYSVVHAAIQRALSSIRPVALATADAPKVSDACFANPVVADVLADGRKIAGAAQRRTRLGLLHQGSIQFDRLPAEFPQMFATELCPSFRLAPLPPAIVESARKIAAERYATAEWMRRR
jgi:lipoate-protein ligase A